MEAEAVLVVAGRLLLVGVRGHQRRVEVEDHPLGRPRQLPDVRPRPRTRAPHRRQALRVERRKHPPGGGIGGNIAEQGRLVAQRTQVGQTVAAVGEHHRQVTQRPAGIVT